MYQQKTSHNKKGQEEMVGFVLIMLVVAVIFLVFLGIYLSKGPPDPKETVEISQFLDAMLEVSTKCEKGLKVLNIADLIVECSISNQSLCNSGPETYCEVARDNIKEITNSTWVFSPDSPKTGYKYKLTVETNTSVSDIAVFTDPPIIFEQSGEYERLIGSEKNLPNGIHIYLEVRTR